MKRGWLIAGIVAGIVLMLGPFWGLFGTVFGMMRAFAILGKSGIGDPSTLSAGIGEVLISTVIGLVACPIGIVLLVACIIQLDRTRRVPPPLPPVER